MSLFIMEETESSPKKGSRVRYRAEVLVLKGKKLLVGRNPKPGPKGAYNIPGGGVAPSESPEEGATRECREEIHAGCKILRKLGEVRYDFPDVYGGRNPAELSEEHRTWLEKENQKAEIVTPS